MDLCMDRLDSALSIAKPGFGTACLQVLITLNVSNNGWQNGRKGYLFQPFKGSGTGMTSSYKELSSRVGRPHFCDFLLEVFAISLV